MTLEERARVRRTPKRQVRKPSLNPHQVHEFAWWYEEKGGIVVVQEARAPDGRHLATESVLIRWPALLRAAQRCYKGEIIIHG